ncbi:MAG: transposase [Burkholderiaceae bacterium]|nr:transposase [Burkholderiaceae bacterium]
MLKDSEISRDTTRHTHRTYTPEFKAQLVATCQQPGASVAALAGQHAMNANVLHRWLKEQEVKIELRKGVLSIVVTRPLSAGADLAGWTATILK